MMLVLQIIWLILPAGLANMSASFVAIIFPKLNYPVDFKKKFLGKRIFGESKTFRGLVAGTIVGVLIFTIQKILFLSHPFFQVLSLFNYQEASWLIGILLGFGALLGDLIKSFFKRQLGIKEGQSWFPFDQVDWIAGGILMIYPLIRLPIFVIILALIIGILLHLFIKFISYLLSIDRSPI